MKYQVSASDYEGLSDDQKALYGDAKDGKHTLKIEGLPQVEDVSGLKSKNAELLTEAKDAKDDARQLRKDLQKATTKKAKEDGDMDALEASWQEKYDTDLGTAHGERDDVLKLLDTAVAHSKAVELATTLAVPGSFKALLPTIEPRIAVEIKDGRAVAVVKDKDGKPSALTVKELGEEIANDPAFAPLIEASKAAGGGANGAQRGGAAKSKTVTKSQWGDMNPSQKMEFSKDGGHVLD